MSQDSGKWVLAHEIRELMGISRTTLDSRVQKGLIASHMSKGRRWYWLQHSPAILTELKSVREEISHIKTLLAQLASPQQISKKEGAQPGVRHRAPRPQKARKPSKQRVPIDTKWKTNLEARIVEVGGVTALAKRLGVATASIYRWRLDKRVPSPEQIEKFREPF